MKRAIITLFMSFALMTGILCPASPAAEAAVGPSPQAEITLLENGDYLETVIVDEPAMSSRISTLYATKTITKTKTTRYKNQAGDILWSVSIHATFSYNGSTSKCTSCSHSTTCPAKTWKIKSVSSSKSGNSATATATATHTDLISEDFTKSVTITCSKNGTVS